MKTNNIGEKSDSLSRRGFLAGAGTLAATGVIASTLLPKLAYAEEEAEQTNIVDIPEEEKIFDGAELSMGRVIHDPDLCAGCRQCEIVCSLSKWGVVNREISSVKINTDILGGYISEAELCKQCAGAECLAMCPNDSLLVDPKTGARVIDQDLCVGCQLCLNACPVVPSRIHYNAAGNTCTKCDLCGGEPKCIEICPTHALSASWLEQEEDTSITNTESGIVVRVELTGAIIVIAKDTIEIANINAIRSENRVMISGDITSNYTQPFIAKIKAAYFDSNGETLYFSERLELEVEVGSTVSFEDVFETSMPDQVASCNLEIMCGKIAG